MEPLIRSIQSCSQIRGVRILGRNEIKTPSYADDTTLTLIGYQSVKNALGLIKIMEAASGLRINENKTQGICIGYKK